MKRLVILILSCFLIGVVSATIAIGNDTVQTTYFPFETLSGKINLTVVDEPVSSNISSNRGDYISLKELVDSHPVLYYECSTSDCSDDYSSEDAEETKILSGSNTYQIGLLLEGTDVNLVNIDFDIATDFSSTPIMPLSINFFEEVFWTFKEFSDDYTDVSRKYGCTDLLSQTTEPTDPIRYSSYCSELAMTQTGAIMMGAVVGGDDDKSITMKLYNSDGINQGECSYNPNYATECKISAQVGGEQEFFETGQYYACVSPPVSGGVVDPTDYLIYTDTSPDESCGLIYQEDFKYTAKENRTKNYAIFVREARFADASELYIEQEFWSQVKVAANDLISSRYHGDCTSGCVLPIQINAYAPQTPVFSALEMDYTNNEDGSVLDGNFHSLVEAPAKISFSENIDLSYTNFEVSKGGLYELFLGEEEIYGDTFSLVPAPIIEYLTPTVAPAGIPVPFLVGVDFVDNGSLTYSWDFGDGETMVTTEPVATHAYADISFYNLNVEVSAGGNLTSSKSFDIQTITPQAYINQTFKAKQDALVNAKSDIGGFSEWIAISMSSKMNITQVEDDISRLERRLVIAVEESDYLTIAKDLVSLKVPEKIYARSDIESVYLTDFESINAEKVSEYTGERLDVSIDNYNQAILRWQDGYISGTIKMRKIFYDVHDGDSEHLLTIYNLDLQNADVTQAYFFIDKPFGVVNYKNDVGAKSLGSDSSFLVFGSDGNLRTEFYAYQDIEFFVSPEFSFLVLDATISEDCNYNSVCDFGEDSKTCRADCKPTGLATFWIIMIVLLGLVGYVGLQYWYEVHYENKLFGDRRQLYNLLMFLANGRIQGKKIPQMRSMLLSQGWSTERVNYAMKKAVGKRTGLPQLVPYSKIQLYLRNTKAKKAAATKTTATPSGNPGMLPMRKPLPQSGITRPRQQKRGNINKSSFQNQGKRK